MVEIAQFEKQADVANKREWEGHLYATDLASGSNGGYSPSMDRRIGNIEVRLEGMDKRFDTVDKRFDTVDKRFDTVDKRLDRIEAEMSSLRYWILGSLVTILIGVAAIVISFGSYQATWFQKSLDRNWEQSQKALDKIDATMMRVERMDAERAAQQK